mmetsp:Transcript_91871/g.192116  ORF Transcript_91871/g.192116 Transcript_91871/m.192116 type:complete len:515 (+) Transcript_91871:99-1643(+)|eukprot:CAMPEP_0206482494 /NCGR_PEP_ID=MMETSP0324_2-20121206/38908_1 /ASSEMBLY_ACC=CAM_ASM_000836 /TAXON_ID=2866 /ORGANISM="Crypthecodinium cohnii, Strain Seligo" /LENGTH=514 /DNA_ID=CAMNT_0053960453 /DNA_START=99 /DNA_END=1643 /DNA_ORIENTATION=-
MLALHSRKVFQAHVLRPASRAVWNVSLPVLSGPGGSHTTKYNIVRPGKDNVEWDDFLLALPEKEHLASMSKEVPLFIRYLKVVTDKEGRPEAFTAFINRAKSGLVVESDVFITSEELLSVMWKNGYSDSERNAIQFTFPADYKFHYPELSVLFDIPEEETYKFCMRTRMEKSHIGELDFSKVKRQGFIRDHWLMFGVGLVIFKYFPFFNYYFGVKVFGTSMWCYTMWTGLNRWIATSCRRNEFMAAQKTANDVMDGEDKIVESMRRFANDAKCVDYLNTFKEDTEAKISTYREALAKKMKQDLTERALKQLQAIAAFEGNMGSAMQELVVTEAAASFKQQFPSDKAMQTKAFESAVKSLSGATTTATDCPVTSHFQSAFKSLEGVDLSKLKGNASGTLPERVAFAQQAKEAEFKSTFMVTPAEASEVKSLAAKAKSGEGYDFSKLPADAADRLDALYASINAKVGYAMPDLAPQAIPMTKDSAANAYIEKVNAQIAESAKTLRQARLTAFVSSF